MKGGEHMSIDGRVHDLIRGNPGITEEEIRIILINEGYTDLPPKGWILLNG